MKKLAMYTVFLLGCVLFMSCEPTIKDVFPDAPKSQLEASLKAWNNNFGAKVTASDWEYKGKIKDETARKDAVDDMTNVTSSYFPSIDATDSLSTATVLKISDDPSITASAIADWKSKIDAETKVGQHLVEVNWKIITSGAKFVTYCTTDELKLLNDNMIMNATGVENSNSCLSKKMWWLWEGDDPANWTRGKIFADLTPTCQNGVPITCNKDCSASMTAGDAQIKCKAKIVQNCCEMDYSWAWACGFKSIKLATDGFTLEIEGRLGSSGKGNGSCTRCCEQMEN